MKRKQIDRYVIIQAIKTIDNNLIPIWNDDIIFDDSEFDDIGNRIRLNGCKYLDVVECIYDLKTKQISKGIELDYYPIDDALEFKKGQNVLYEKSYRKLSECTIVDIVYEEFVMEIKFGGNFDKRDIEKFKDIKIDVDKFYVLKWWTPFYVLDNNIKIKHSNQLYHKA